MLARPSPCSRSPRRRGSCSLPAIPPTCFCSKWGWAAGWMQPTWVDRPACQRDHAGLVRTNARASRRYRQQDRRGGKGPAFSSPACLAIVAAQPREALAAIERQGRAGQGADRGLAGEDWTATEERGGRLVYQDDAGTARSARAEALWPPPVRECRGRHRRHCAPSAS